MKSTWNIAIAACIGAVIGFAVGQHVTARAGSPIRPAMAQNAGAQQPMADQIFKVPLGDAPQLGDEGAKVTIVEFSDFECPYCGRVIPTLHQIEKEYGSDVRIVFKENPLPMHPNAPYAAKASIAAQKQGKFWQMHDKLFEANNSHQPGALAQAKVDEMAKSIGLDMEQYKKDVNDPSTAQRIQADQAEAQKLAANGTPHFFINGVRMAGALPFDSFKAVIDRQMARANQVLASGVSRKDLYETLVKDGQTGPSAPPQPREPQATARNVDPGDGPAIGSKKPKVTIVEFSDFQCPYCGRVEPTLKQIRDTYKDDVKLVWRNEPLPFHPNALPAAKAAMAAAKQGNAKFWQMHDLMFANQSQLSEAKYEEWAKQIGLNVPKWKAEKDSKEIADAITKDSTYAQSVGADGTPSFFLNGKFISGAMPFETFKGVIDEQIKKADELLKKGTSHENLYKALVAENVKSSGSPTAANDQKVEVQAGNSPSIGPKNAPVTIVEWSDFQCPYCSRVEPTLKQLMDDYKGKVRLVWKNQPLPFHPNAMPAAEAAMAAYEQGNDKFWAMHDKLFANQQQLSPAFYEEAAKDAGVDVAKWKAAVDSHAAKAAIDQDMSAGAALGANGTPTFFINGHKLLGALPIDSFKQVIDAELAAKVAHK